MQVSRLAFAVSVAVAAVALAGPARAADYNYMEVVGNVVAVQSVTEVNAWTGSSHLKDVSITVRSLDGGDNSITLSCPLAYTAIRDLCKDTFVMLASYCPTATATSSCIPNPANGLCDVVRYDSCTSGAGKCVWGWGYLSQTAGQQRSVLDALFTRAQTACTAK